MSKQFIEVAEFNRSLLGIKARRLGEQPEKEFTLTITQLYEEVEELEAAFRDKDFIAQLDALVDLNYFLLGALYKMGVHHEMYEKLFSAVHNCNMLKKAGVNEKRGDHGAVDASKPNDWVNPEIAIARILDEG